MRELSRESSMITWESWLSWKVRQLNRFCSRRLRWGEPLSVVSKVGRTRYPILILDQL